MKRKFRNSVLFLVAMLIFLSVTDINSLQASAMEEELALSEETEALDEILEEEEETKESDEFAELEDYGISLFSNDLTFTDTNGNRFTYEELADGRITITEIISNGGTLIIPSVLDGKSVASIDNNSSLVLRNPSPHLDTLEIHCPMIGARAFQGANIGTLILGEEVTELPESSDSNIAFHYWLQFSQANIDTLRLEAVHCKTTHFQPPGYTPSFYGPFQYASIGTLEIGDKVQEIPELFLMDATLSMDYLSLHVPTIGAYSFYGAGHSFGTLEIGSEVENLGDSYLSSNVACYWNQFGLNTIGTLRFGAANLTMTHEVTFSNICSFQGAFEQAQISSLQIADSVETIPDFFLYNASCNISELTLTQSAIGAMSFKSPNLSIGTLTIAETVQSFPYTEYSSNGLVYWEQFGGISIDTLIWNVPNLSVGTQRRITYPYNAFHQARVGKLILGSQVESLPDYLFSDVILTQDALEIHVKSLGVGVFKSNSLEINHLVIGEEVETFLVGLDGSTYFYNQFSGATIKELTYAAVNATTGTNCYQGPFFDTKIEALHIDGKVQTLPAFLFYQSKLSLEEFTLNTPQIGYRCFSGSSVNFEHLTVGENVTLFQVNANGQNMAFAECVIDKLTYNATAAQMESLVSNTYGPFGYFCVIRELEIGDAVTTIPYGCFRNSNVHASELTINQASIGYGAFMGSDIHIEELYLGENVSYLGLIDNRMNCFNSAVIDKLTFNVTAISPTWSSSTSAYGMFLGTHMGELTFGDAVERIPAFMFRGVYLEQETLTISCSWSYYCFNSTDVRITNLILNGDVATINALSYKNNAFTGNVIENVLYDIPYATFDSDNYSTYGPFSSATITNFTIGEHVIYLDNFLLRGLSVTNFYVHPVKASEAHLKQTFAKSYMPKCQTLYVHYNSDFKAYFQSGAIENSWMCLDHFDITAGEKYYDEVSESYIRELSKECRICGYKTEEKEILDPTYNVYLSIPLEIPLTFQSDEKSYEGTGRIYAYGSLGNAYEGIAVEIAKDSPEYGVAKKEAVAFSIQNSFHPSFEGSTSEKAFTAKELSDNDISRENGQDSFADTEIRVSVDAVGFITGGAGEYTIGVPLRIRLY